MRSLPISLILAICFLAASYSAYGQCRDVRIPRGKFSTTVSGATKSSYTCYRVRAKSSQRVTLHLDASDPATVFNLSEDYYDADFTAESVRDWTGRTGNVDAYMVMVGGGRRGTPYKLSVTIR